MHGKPFFISRKVREVRKVFKGMLKIFDFIKLTPMIVKRAYANASAKASHFSTTFCRLHSVVIRAAFGRFMRHSRIQKHFNRHMYSRCMVRSGEAGMRPRRRRRVARGSVATESRSGRKRPSQTGGTLRANIFDYSRIRRCFPLRFDYSL